LRRTLEPESISEERKRENIEPNGRRVQHVWNILRVDGITKGEMGEISTAVLISP